MLEVMVDGAYQYDDDDKGIMVLEVMVDGVPSTDPPSKPKPIGPTYFTN